MKAIELAKKGLITTKTIIINHGPTILIILGVGGFVMSEIIIARVSPEAKEALDAVEADSKREEIFMKGKIITKYYGIPAAISLLSSLLIFGSNNINRGRIAAALAALKISQKTLDGVREESKKIVGEKKTNEIFEKSVVDRSKEIAYDASEPEPTGLGDQLWVDVTFDKKFRISPENMKSAVNDFKTIIWNNDYASVQDFYDLINLYDKDVESRGIKSRLGISKYDFDEFKNTSWDKFKDVDIFTIEACKNDYESYMILSWDHPDHGDINPLFDTSLMRGKA